MKVFLKELVSVIAILFTALISRNMYVQLYDVTRLVDPIDQVRIMPGLVRGVLLSLFILLFVYACTRYWVWDHKSWKNVGVYTVFVFPVMYGFVFVLSGLLFLLSLLTVTKTGFVQDITKLVCILLWLMIVGVWAPYLTARCAHGKNPWYSMYDAVGDMWSRRSLHLLAVYSVPTVFLILSLFLYWNTFAMLPLYWFAYLFARQYIVSKKHSLKQYLQFLWHDYHKTIKTVYKKVVKS